ncbi:MAG: VWA domain-containing protein, partial [Verrucomicrobiaceae bacterium]
MRTILLSVLSAGLVAAQALAGGGAACATNHALTLKVSPEREVIHRKGTRDIIVQVELEGRRPDTIQRSPMNLAVVLDRSTSMIGPKIEKARQAAATLVDQLDANDVFSLVTYDNESELLIPPQRLSRREDRERAKATIFAIQPRGGTALYAGVSMGAEQVKRLFEHERVNRVILLSDGQANIGPSKPGDLAQFGSVLRKGGISVSTVGLGEDYNEDLMTALAESSNANYYYVQDAEKLPGIFAEELGAARTVLARSITIRIEVPEGVRLKEILGHPEIRCEGRSAVITLPEYFGADRRKFLARCTVENAEVEAVKLANVAVKYE